MQTFVYSVCKGPFPLLCASAFHKKADLLLWPSVVHNHRLNFEFASFSPFAVTQWQQSSVAQPQSYTWLHSPSSCSESPCRLQKTKDRLMPSKSPSTSGCKWSKTSSSSKHHPDQSTFTPSTKTTLERRWKNKVKIDVCFPALDVQVLSPLLSTSCAQ